MEEEKKKKTLKMLWTALAIGVTSFVLGAFIGGCTAKMDTEKPVNALTSEINGYEKVYELDSPKKTYPTYPSDPIEINVRGPRPLNWESLGSVNDSGTLAIGYNSFTISNYLKEETDQIIWYWDNGYISVSWNDGEGSAEPQTESSLTGFQLWNGPWTALYELTFTHTETAKTNLHYEFPEGSPTLKLKDLNNDNLIQEWQAGGTYEVEKRLLLGKYLTIAPLDAKWSSSTAYDDDLSASASTNHQELRFQTAEKTNPNDIYITPYYQIVQINNRTGYSMDYGTYSFSITTNTGTNQVSGSRSIVAWSKAVDQFSSSPNEKYLTIWCDYPFTVKHDGFASGYYTAIYGNRNDTFMKDKYFITIAKEEIMPNGTITIQLAGSEGEESNLKGPLALIGQAFGTLMPILQIKIFGDFTIGLLVAIPLIFAMIVMIFKLIKK